jgi:hypothetical protein
MHHIKRQQQAINSHKSKYSAKGGEEEEEEDDAP